MVDEYNEQSYESCVCKSCSIAVLVPKFIRWWWNPEFGHLVHLACFYLLCNSLINQHQIQNHTLKHFYWQAASAAAPLLAFVTVFFGTTIDNDIYEIMNTNEIEKRIITYQADKQAAAYVLLLLLLLLVYYYYYYCWYISYCTVGNWYRALLLLPWSTVTMLPPQSVARFLLC